MILVPLGSTTQIGASCLYLKFGETGILLDAGQDPEDDGPDGVPRLDMIKPDWPVDHAVITHAHHDHMGSIPSVLKAFPRIALHMTRATRMLVEMLLPASARLQQRKFLEGSSTHSPLFDVDQAVASSYVFQGYNYNEPIPLMGEFEDNEVVGSFYDAGHVLGSTGILIEGLDNGAKKRVFYSSDTNLQAQSIIPGGDYPTKDVDVMFIEATLGADDQAELTTRAKEEVAFREAIVETLARGGTVLIPVFALGRAQEIIALIDEFKAGGDIAEEIPVYTSGSMRAIADIYDRTRYTTPRIDADFEVFGVKQKRMPRNQKRAMATVNEPSIHIAASGMMFEKTLSNRLARNMVEHERHSILLVGYAKDDSPARLLTDAAAQGKGTLVKLAKSADAQAVNCDVKRFRFSGHCHRQDLLTIVEKVNPKKLVLVHAETPGKMWLADAVRAKLPEIEIFLPEQGKPLSL